MEIWWKHIARLHSEVKLAWAVVTGSLTIKIALTCTFSASNESSKRIVYDNVQKTVFKIK